MDFRLPGHAINLPNITSPVQLQLSSPSPTSPNEISSELDQNVPNQTNTQMTIEQILDKLALDIVTHFLNARDYFMLPHTYNISFTNKQCLSNHS